ncbi:MAG: alpha/beta hydrolase-fold protein, partial [Clostridia bacterium]
FNISRLPQDTFVIGQSMGGYGAMKWFLNDLEKFGGVGTLSGSFDLQKVVENNPDLADEFTALFGQSLVIGEENDVFEIAKKSVVRDKKIYIACGTEDNFIADSEKLKAIFDKNGTQAKYNFESGCHNWDFWGEELPKSLEYLLR